MSYKKSSLTVLIIALVYLMFWGPHYQAGQAGQRVDPEKKQIIQGREVYLHYCASCHGVDAKGRGSVSPALKKHPPDLTQINVRYGGFPTAKIRRIIIGEAQLPIHGENEMPVWGGILRDPDLANLMKYLESIQRAAEVIPAKTNVK